jgi:nucleoside-diphosphate-sugar epimerase
MARTSRFHPTPEFWRGKRVFVTGHTGFKGSWLTLWLAELGARVRGYALTPDTEPSMFRALAIDGVCDSIIADVRDQDHLAAAMAEFRPDVAIHLAAQSLVRPSYRDPLGTFATNVQGTANFLEGCRGVDWLRAVVVVTTDKCYLNRERLAPYDEDEPLGGRDPYSASKACAELVTQAYRFSFFNPSRCRPDCIGARRQCLRRRRLVRGPSRSRRRARLCRRRDGGDPQPRCGSAVAACHTAAHRLPVADARPVRRRAGLCDRFQFRASGRPGTLGAQVGRANGRSLG